jgi:hypothetical protein
MITNRDNKINSKMETTKDQVNFKQAIQTTSISKTKEEI